MNSSQRRARHRSSGLGARQRRLTFVGWQQPVGCAGVAVFPDDLIVADGAEAVEQERMEAWIMAEVGRGATLRPL